MPNASGSAIHEHRADRRGEGIVHRQFFESVIADEFLSGVPGEFAFRSGIDNAGSKQCVFYIMPAPRARVRVRAFLRDRCRLHQPPIDVPINPAGIILRNNGD